MASTKSSDRTLIVRKLVSWLLQLLRCFVHLDWTKRVDRSARCTRSTIASVRMEASRTSHFLRTRRLVQLGPLCLSTCCLSPRGSTRLTPGFVAALVRQLEDVIILPSRDGLLDCHPGSTNYKGTTTKWSQALRLAGRTSPVLVRMRLHTFSSMSSRLAAKVAMIGGRISKGARRVESCRQSPESSWAG